MSDPFVIVASGQSNMAGYGTGGTLLVDAGVQIWNPSTSAFETSDLSSQVTLACGGTVGGLLSGVTRNNIAVAFAHRVRRETARSVYLIIEALGGTKIVDGWTGGSPTVYPSLASSVAAALSAIGASKIDAFLWHQGESDQVLGTTAAAYWTAITELHATLSAESWWRDDTKFIAGEIVFRDGGISDSLRRLNDGELPGALCALSPGLTTMPDGHIDGAALFDFGYERYWTVFAARGREWNQGSFSAAAWKGLGSNPTIGGLYVNGAFVQHGPLVTFKIEVAFTSVSGGSGLLRLNVPDLPMSKVGALDILTMGQSNGFTSAPVYASPVVGTHDFAFRNVNGGQQSVGVLKAAGGIVSFGGSYFTSH